MCFFFSSRRRHTRYWRDWSSDVLLFRSYIDYKSRYSNMELPHGMKISYIATLHRVMTQEDDSEMQETLKDRKSTRLNSSHANISYAVFCLKKKQLKYLTTSYPILTYFGV